MNVVLKSIKFIDLKHYGLVRKSSNKPYITHPIYVSYILMSYKQKSKNLDKLLAACILHDVLEDTNTTFEELVEQFGPLISSLVLELTSDKEEIEKVGKNEYLKIKIIGMSSYALTLKLCDRLANISDNPKISYINDTLELMNHIKKNRKLSKTQKNLIKDICFICENKI